MKRNLIAVALLLPAPLAVSGENFRMQVMDTFSIRDSKIVVTGQIASGSVALGEVICLVRADTGETVATTVDGIEQFRKILESAGQGEHVGLLLSDIKKDQVARGDSLRSDC